LEYLELKNPIKIKANQISLLEYNLEYNQNQQSPKIPSMHANTKKVQEMRNFAAKGDISKKKILNGLSMEHRKTARSTWCCLGTI
jgi:hypothetical protein